MTKSKVVWSILIGRFEIKPLNLHVEIPVVDTGHILTYRTAYTLFIYTDETPGQILSWTDSRLVDSVRREGTEYSDHPDGAVGQGRCRFAGKGQGCLP